MHPLKVWLKTLFSEVIEDMHATEETYEKYFSKEYTQKVDGKILTYTDFVAHMKAQKAKMESLKVTFEQMVVEDNRMATIHVARGFKKAGGEIVMKVIAFFHVKDNKIIHCEELSRLLEGEEADKDLASHQ